MATQIPNRPCGKTRAWMHACRGACYAPAVHQLVHGKQHQIEVFQYSLLLNLLSVD